MKNLIEKLLKGETLTADERAKLEGFDPEKAANDAAAAARKKAESERDAARTELETLKKSVDEGKKGSQTETQKLLARIEKLEKEKADADALLSAAFIALSNKFSPVTRLPQAHFPTQIPK